MNVKSTVTAPNDPDIAPKTRTSLNHRRDSDLEGAGGTLGELGKWFCVVCAYDRRDEAGGCGWCGRKP